MIPPAAGAGAGPGESGPADAGGTGAARRAGDLRRDRAAGPAGTRPGGGAAPQRWPFCPDILTVS
jgi:hypothetical protein